jgi:hypothetical protein
MASLKKNSLYVIPTKNVHIQTIITPERIHEIKKSSQIK